MSGTLVKTIGFDRMLYGIAVLNFLYAPLMYILRSPPTKEEKKVKYSLNLICGVLFYVNLMFK